MNMSYVYELIQHEAVTHTKEIRKYRRYIYRIQKHYSS